MAVLFAASAEATIEATLNYKDHGDAPIWDSDGTALSEILESAIEHWNDCLPWAEDEITINYSWWNPYTPHGPFLPDVADVPKWAKTTRPNGLLAPKTFNIKFHTIAWDKESEKHITLQWYVDESPEEDSEFAMQPSTYASSSSASRVTGSPDPFLELGYRGQARFPDVEGGDLYTVALREVGHALGMGFRNKREARRTGSYTVPSSLPMGGFQVAAWIDDSGKIDPAFLGVPSALMTPELDENTRVLPSAVDILTISAINDWTIGWLPRTFTGAGATGHLTALSWTSVGTWHDEVPSSALGVFGAMVMQMGNPNLLLTAEKSAQDLFLDLEATLLIDGGSLSVTHVSTMSPSSILQLVDGSFSTSNLFHDGTSIEILQGGSLRAHDSIFVGNESMLVLSGGPSESAKLTSGVLQLEDARMSVSIAESSVTALFSLGTDSIISGGRSEFSISQAMRNDGEIRAENGDLAFNFGSSHGVNIDLDGSPVVVDEPPGTAELGRIIAQNGSISFNAGPTDEFNGLIEVGYQESVSFGGELVLGSGGLVDLLSDQAMLAGEHIDVAGGTIEVSPEWGVSCLVAGKTTWSEGGSAKVAAGATLVLGGQCHFAGGTTSLGGGKIVQVGDIVATGDSVVGVDTYDWNGNATTGNRISVEAGASLRIASRAVGDPFLGTIVVKEGAVLVIEPDWELTGELILEGGTIQGGSFTNHGTIRGWGSIEADFTNLGILEEIASGIAY